jgi:hypothetical protein
MQNVKIGLMQAMLLANKHHHTKLDKLDQECDEIDVMIAQLYKRLNELELQVQMGTDREILRPEANKLFDKVDSLRKEKREKLDLCIQKCNEAMDFNESLLKEYIKTMVN